MDLCLILFWHLGLWRYRRIYQNVRFQALDVHHRTFRALRVARPLLAVRHRWSEPVAVGVDCCPGKLPPCPTAWRSHRRGETQITACIKRTSGSSLNMVSFMVWSSETYTWDVNHAVKWELFFKSVQKRAACLGPDLAPADFSGAVSSPSAQILSFFSWLSKNAIDSLSGHLSKLGRMVDCF